MNNDKQSLKLVYLYCFLLLLEYNNNNNYKSDRADCVTTRAAPPCHPYQYVEVFKIVSLLLEKRVYPYNCHMFCVVPLQKAFFLTFCAFGSCLQNASSQLCFRLLFCRTNKLFFPALPIPSSDTVRACVCVCVCARRACACVVSVIVKCPVLPPSVVDGRSRNPLYYYYY